MSAAGEHLKIAGSHLRAAAQALQQQTADLRHQIDMADQDTRRQVDEIHKAINNNNAWLARPNASDMERADRMRQNARLDSDIADRQHEFARIRDETNQRIANIERQINSLNSQAGQFESMGSSM